MIRLFVGCSPNSEDLEAMAVLEYSARKHCSEELNITWMRLSRDPSSFWYSDGDRGWQTARWATTFSCFRFAIPAFCAFEGRALYADTDVIFQGDLAELWRQPIPPGKIVLGKGGGSWRLCVSLWDCAAAKPHLPSIERLRSNPSAHTETNAKIRAKDLIAPFSGDWNCLDGQGYTNLSDPCAIHYTSIDTQPATRHALKRLATTGERHWYDGKVREHPRRDLVVLFDRLLAEAQAAGYPLDRYIPAQPFGDYRKASLAHYKGRAA